MKIFSFTLPLAVGGLAAWLTMGSMSQYAALVQPPLAPPAWIFPVAWTILYVLMGWASLRVRQSGSPERSNALALYYTQLAVNFVWPLLFFRVGLYGTAFWWLILLLALVLVTVRAFYRIDKQAGWLLVPYLAWLIYAAYLNAGVWFLNK